MASYADRPISEDAQTAVNEIADNLYDAVFEMIGTEVAAEAQGPVVGAEQFRDEEDLEFLQRIGDEVRARLIARLNGE